MHNDSLLVYHVANKMRRVKGKSKACGFVVTFDMMLYDDAGKR